MEWEAKEKKTTGVHGSHGQSGPFDYSVMSKDGTGDHYFWTTEPPETSGWYWVKSKYLDDSIPPFIVEVQKAKNGKTLIFSVGVGWLAVVEDFTHWLGPLPVPDAPGQE